MKASSITCAEDRVRGKGKRPHRSARRCSPPARKTTLALHTRVWSGALVLQHRQTFTRPRLTRCVPSSSLVLSSERFSTTVQERWWIFCAVNSGASFRSVQVESVNLVVTPSTCYHHHHHPQKRFATWGSLRPVIDPRPRSAESPFEFRLALRFIPISAGGWRIYRTFGSL